MNNIFDGKSIRDVILKRIADQNAISEKLPHLAVILATDNPICAKYVELKKQSALKVGITLSDYLFNKGETQQEIIDCIEHLNGDEEVDGIMIQVPVDGKYDRDELIKAISPKKDVDGLRYCLGLDSDFKPPVVEAILEALKKGVGLDASMGKDEGLGSYKHSKQTSISTPKPLIITIIGQGFLVGKPLERALEGLNYELRIMNKGDLENHNSLFIIYDSDIVISAVGKANLIKPDMVKEGVVLIDAGTTEANGCLVGDIDPECYKKASYYTPVPGGIGPVTIAKLFQNLARNG
jgi:methylenetetrahydrofolate dehydrogenase (NADP+) / methenyltetrahydrofolate cyclohydrolase